MKTKLLSFLILISNTFEFRSNSFIRKLNEDSIDIDVTEPETNEPSQDIPHHPIDTVNDTNIPDIISNKEGDSTIKDTTNGIIIPNHSYERQDSSREETTNIIDSSIMPNATDTTIPTTISDPEYPSNLDTSKFILILVDIGYFRGPFRIYNPIEVLYTFIVYYLRINFFYPLPLHMRITITITYTYRNRGFFRALQEDGKKDVEADCTRYTYDYDNNAKYNCTFPLDVNQTIVNVTSDGKTTFIVSDENFKPTIIATSYANKTMFEDGLQNREDNEILENKNLYILNNTILEENGLKFKLTGESHIPINDNRAILSFDEKGNGNIKNATCDIYKLEGNIYELSCTANVNIKAELDGVSGITSNTGEEIIIIMKPGSNTILNANSGYNYISLYNRKSSSGLSGGAIAGIVIACTVALLAIAIGGLLCRRNKIPSPFQESTLGVNVSNNNNLTD